MINLIRIIVLMFVANKNVAQTPTIVMKTKGSYYIVDREPKVRDTIISRIIHGAPLFDGNPNVNRYIESMYGKDTLADLFITKLNQECFGLGIKVNARFSGNIFTFNFFYPDSIQMKYRVFLRREENSIWIKAGAKTLDIDSHRYSEIEYTYGRFKTFYDKWKNDADLEFAKATLLKDGSRNVEHQIAYDNDDDLQLYCNLVARMMKADLNIPEYWSIRLADNLAIGDNLQCLKDKMIAIGLHPKDGRSVDVNNGKRTYLMDALPHGKNYYPIFMIAPVW